MLHQDVTEPTAADAAPHEVADRALTRAEREAEHRRAAHRLREARRLAKPSPVPAALRFSRQPAARPRELTAAAIFTF